MRDGGSYFLHWFSSEQLRVSLPRNPCKLGRRHERWVRRSRVLEACDKLSVLGSVMMLVDSEIANRYETKTRFCKGVLLLSFFSAA